MLQLHLAALGSLKAEIAELHGRLLRTGQERDTLQQALATTQVTTTTATTTTTTTRTQQPLVSGIDFSAKRGFVSIGSRSIDEATVLRVSLNVRSNRRK